ncbi:MAG TPA: SCO family protein [Candidatus Acidoferrales bacterium]|nr:SCO family protein [Candidatus Acidoferrales bacterium]
MNGSAQRLPLTIWIGFGLFIVLLGLMYLLSLAEYGQARRKALPVLGRVADFTLTNEEGNVTTLADLTNRVWVADIIFTRCAGNCPIMSTQMKSLQDALPATSGAKLVTLTTDPDYDAPAILKRYGERYGADFRRWTFLTGTKSELAGLAAGSLKLGSTPVAPPDRQSAVDLFVHSTIFVVVDKQGQLRGVFQTEGQDVDWTRVKLQVLATVKRLEGE